MISDIRGHLPIHNFKRYRRRSIQSITDVVIHHSAIDGTAESFAHYHVKTKGWPGIGYHYVIDADGDISYCNSIDTTTYHCSNNNTKSIGICLVGDFQTQQPTWSQEDELLSLLTELHSAIGHFTLGYHGQYKPTLCPGQHMIDTLSNRFNNSALWTLKK